MSAQQHMQAEEHCVELESEAHALQTQLSTQGAELAELRAKTHAQEVSARDKAFRSDQEEDQTGSKAMQATTRSVLLAQVWSHGLTTPHFVWCHTAIL